MMLHVAPALHTVDPNETATSDGDVTGGKFAIVSNTLRPFSELVFPDNVAFVGDTLVNTGALKY